MTSHRIILASASPRRRELLAQLGVAFDVVPSPFAELERKPPGVAPEAWTQALAYFKARAVAEQHTDRWVLGADTIVVCDGRVLGKAATEAEAREMLELQARCESRVITGVCLVRLGVRSERLGGSDTTRVWMHDDATVREAYLAGGDWQGKAGAYGLQDVGDRLVARVEGSPSNVVGLPLELVARLLRSARVPLCPVTPGRPPSVPRAGLPGC